MSSQPSDTSLKRTPLYDFHVSRGAKMVPFAGYDMPVQYALGVLKEHLWTRQNAGLFDVSHMGQASLIAADGKHATVARALETLVPADILNLLPGQQRYTQLLAADGGILDDLMVTRPIDPDQQGVLDLVVNAGCKDADYLHLRAHLPEGVVLSVAGNWSLLALQGPKARDVMAELLPAATGQAFMTVREYALDGVLLVVSRSGYTGEDGYEIAVRDDDAVAFAARLLGFDVVQPIGLGARDSLRLEAGLCLYGHDIDATTSPIEAGLAWSIQKRRRVEGGFPGAERIQAELAAGPKHRRVGIKPDGRAPAREGTVIQSVDGATVGRVTSGGFGPSVNGPIAMGYVDAAHAAPACKLNLIVREKPLAASVVALPFAPHRYFKPA